MNGFERQKHGLQLSQVPQHRVQDLGADLMGLFGSAAKGVDTYAKVGEASARLEFASMYRSSLEELDMMKRAMDELPNDDVQSRVQMAGRMEEIKGSFTSKLADFSDNPAAYEAFATASSEALHSINNSYQTPMFQSMQKAQIVRTTNDVNNEYSALGLKTVPSIAQTNLEKLKVIYNETDAKEHNKKFIGASVIPSIITADASFNPLEIIMQTTTTDKTTGVTLSDIHKTKDFVNKNILQNSETAQLRVEEGEDGIERFVVDGMLNDEDNLKIIRLADKYMQYSKAPKDNKGSSIILDALVGDVTKITSEYDVENPTPSINQFNDRYRQYEQTDEYKHIVMNGSDDDRLKLAGLKQKYEIFHKKASIIEHLIKYPSTATLAKLKSGNGIPIEVTALTSYFDTKNPDAKTTMYLSKEDADLVLGRIDSRAKALYSAGNYVEADRLWSTLTNFDGQNHGAASKIVTQIKNGDVLSISSQEDKNKAIAVIDASNIPVSEKVNAKQVLSKLEFKDGKPTLASIDMSRGKAQNIKDSTNAVIEKITSSLNETFGFNNRNTRDQVSLAIQDAATTHDISLDNPTVEDIEKIKNLVASKQARIDTKWFEDIVIYNKTGLAEDQLSMTIEDIADKMKVGDKTVTDDEGVVRVDYTANNFKINYGKAGKTMQFTVTDDSGRIVRKSKVFSLNQKDDDSIQKYYWNFKAQKKGK